MMSLTGFADHRDVAVQVQDHRLQLFRVARQLQQATAQGVAIARVELNPVG